MLPADLSSHFLPTSDFKCNRSRHGVQNLLVPIVEPSGLRSNLPTRQRSTWSACMNCSSQPIANPITCSSKFERCFGLSVPEVIVIVIAFLIPVPNPNSSSVLILIQISILNPRSIQYKSRVSLQICSPLL